MNVCLIVTTIDSEPGAQKLGLGLIEKNLAACVQISPIASIYRWEGKIEHAREWRLDVKTAKEKASKVQEFLGANHPYETPEILRFDATDASADYLAWVLRA